MADIADVIVRNGKGYLSTWGQIENNGPYVTIEPIYTVNLNIAELTNAFEKVIASGHPQLPEPTHEEVKKRVAPMLRITKTKSWKELAKNGAAYTIEWNPDHIALYMSRLDKKGRFEADPNKTKQFPKETPLQAIVEAILADAASRPAIKREGS